MAALPIENTTAELLAQWLGEHVATALTDGGHGNITRIDLEVEEMPGQSGGYARVLGAGPPAR